MNPLKTIDRVPSIAFKSLLPFLLVPLLLTNQSVLGQTDAGTASEQSSGQTQNSTQTSRNPANPPVKLDDSTATPESGNIWKRKYLLGDEGGVRSKLEAKGLTFDLYYIADALDDPYGAPEDFGVWGRIRASMDVDFSKFTPDKGLTFHATGLWQYGTNLSTQYTNTAVNSTDLPSAHTLRLDSYFIQQYLFDHKLAIRTGQIAAYDTYGDAEYGASFINLAMGYAHTNLNSAAYLSFNPAGVPAFEVKVLPTDHFYVKTMVLSEERNPYVQDPSGFSFHLGGPVFAGETGYLVDPPKPANATNTMGAEPFITDSETGNHPGIYRFGAGYDPHNFTDLLTNATVSGNYVIYGQIDQAVYRLSNTGPDKNRGLDLTYSQDYAPGNVTQYSDQIAAGARWIGPAGGRWSKDMIGLGYVRTTNGSHYRELMLAKTGKNLGAENLIEVNYLSNVTPWLVFQPVMQWFVKPQGDATRPDVFVIGFRTKVTF
ncbi:MAG TPA: carbohydrate porin [Granulicella sp.]